MESIRSILNRLAYDLNYLSRFDGKPCYITFEYKYYVVSLGIAKLESLYQSHQGDELQDITTLLAAYRKAHQTIM